MFFNDLHCFKSSSKIFILFLFSLFHNFFILDGKTRTPPTALGADHNEHIIIFRFGELLCGVIDKASVGNASLGIIHAVFELYGPELAGRLLTAFGRLFTYFLQGMFVHEEIHIPILSDCSFTHNLT
jgi:hypothetical protein